MAHGRVVRHGVGPFEVNDVFVVPTLRRERGSARADLIETLTTSYAHAIDGAPIEITDRARVRLACTNAIQGAAKVADFAEKRAGVDAVFPEQPVREPLRRHAHALSADPSTWRPFRVGRADRAPRAAPRRFYRDRRWFASQNQEITLGAATLPGLNETRNRASG
jgi:hypothetical protein